MSEAKGLVNVYTCPTCGWQMVTINLDEGTTPMFVRCGGQECDNDTFPGATSAMYRCPQDLTPTHEWYRPKTASERKKLRGEDMRRHVELGGLLLREARR